MAANLLGQCVAGIPCRSLVKRLLSAVPSCTQSTPPQETYANHILADEEFEAPMALKGLEPITIHACRCTKMRYNA